MVFYLVKGADKNMKSIVIAKRILQTILALFVIMSIVLYFTTRGPYREYAVDYTLPAAGQSSAPKHYRPKAL